MRILKYILYLILFLIALLLVVAMFLPSSVHIERMQMIEAEPAVVFEQVDVIRNWENWSPWLDKDPDAELIYFGPARGAGAGYSWQGPETGEGEIKLIESIPYSQIVYEVDFGGSGFATGRFEFTETMEGTRVYWSMHTELGYNPVFRYFGLFLDVMVGHDFDEGLRNLKNLVEN